MIYYIFAHDCTATMLLSKPYIDYKIAVVINYFKLATQTVFAIFFPFSPIPVGHMNIQQMKNSTYLSINVNTDSSCLCVIASCI